jgi:hypothetical protein
MSGQGIVALATELAADDPAVCDRAGLAAITRRCAQARSWLDALETRVVMAAQRLEEPVAPLLAARGARSVRAAEAASRRAGVCELLPGVHDALAAGSLSGEHVDAIARLASEVGDAGRSSLAQMAPVLITAASGSSVEAYRRELSKLAVVLSRDDGVGADERMRRQRCVKQWVDTVTGMGHTELVLDPLRHASVVATLSAAVARECGQARDERSLDHVKADVMVDLITGARTEHPPVPEVVVLVDAGTLRDGPHDRTVAETGPGQAVPVEAIRQLCCEGDTIEVTIDRAGVVLDHGRARRVASAAQRRALRAMYRTCAHPGCDVGFAACDIHHVTPWQHGGRSDLSNLLPLCSRHHHNVHEGGWRLTLRADRTIRLVKPDGEQWFEDSTVDVAPTGVDDGVDDLIRARAAALAPPGSAA